MRKHVRNNSNYAGIGLSTQTGIMPNLYPSNKWIKQKDDAEAYFPPLL